MAKTKKKTPRAILTMAHAYLEGENPVHVYLSGLGIESQRTMGSAIDSVADILSNGRTVAERLAWHRIRAQHVNALRGRLQELYVPSTANRYLSALRGVLKEAWRMGLLDRETMERTIDVAPIRGSRQMRGRAVMQNELRAIFDACGASQNRAGGARDAAIIALLYGSGLRRSEAAGLELDNLDLEKGCLSVVGKGNKERLVFLPQGTIDALRVWLSLRTYDSGPLFCHVSKGGNVKLKAVSDALIYLILQKRHKEAGVAAFTPHDLRRSFISDLLDEGIDLSTVAKQVGHSNVQTTARYDRRTERAQQKAALALNVPFRP